MIKVLYPILVLSLTFFGLGCDFDSDSDSSSDVTSSPSSSSTSSANASTDVSTPAATSIATASDGGGGFLWKPVSESNGKLVVLLPTGLRGKIQKVEIHNEDPPTSSSLVADGQFAGDTHNGNRPHYRFANPGAAYGKNIFLIAFLTDGRVISYPIPDGSKRLD